MQKVSLLEGDHGERNSAPGFRARNGLVPPRRARRAQRRGSGELLRAAIAQRNRRRAIAGGPDS